MTALVEADFADFDGFRNRHRGGRAHQIRWVGASSAENADFVLIQTHLSLGF